MQKADPKLVTATAAAKALGISPSTFHYHKGLGRWARCGRMVRGAMRYDVTKLRRAYAEQTRESHHKGRGQTQEALEADRDLKRAQLEKLRLSNAETFRDLVPLERVQANREKFEKHTRGILEALPAMLADELATAGEPEDVEVITRTAVDGALAEIHGGPSESR